MTRGTRADLKADAVRTFAVLGWLLALVALILLMLRLVESLS